MIYQMYLVNLLLVLKKYFHTNILKKPTDFTTHLTNSGSQVSLVELQIKISHKIVHITPWIQSQLISGERHNLFKLHTLGDGGNYNKEFKVSIFNVKVIRTSILLIMEHSRD